MKREMKDDEINTVDVVEGEGKENGEERRKAGDA